MKKSLFVLGVAALALASCTNEEVVNIPSGKAISFAGSGINNITKADIEVGNFASFQVFGSYNAEGNIFDNVTVSKSESTWTYGNPQYWQDAQEYKFGAYAPVDADAITATWAHATGLTLEVNSDADNQNDVVYAAATASTNDPNDYLNMAPVSLTFNHLLSKIQFAFKLDNTLAGLNVSFSNFSVSGIATNAKWVAGTQEAATTPATGAYEAFETAKTITGATAEAETEAFYVIPQTVGSFAVTMTVEATDAGGEVVKTGTVTTSVPSGTWTAQYAYRYTATLTIDNIDDDDDPSNDPKPIEFTVDASTGVDAWENGTGGTMNLQ